MCVCVCPSHSLGLWGEEFAAGRECGVGGYLCPQCTLYILVARCRRVLIVRPHNSVRAKTIGYIQYLPPLYIWRPWWIRLRFTNIFSQLENYITFFDARKTCASKCTRQPKRSLMIFHFFFLNKCRRCCGDLYAIVLFFSIPLFTYIYYVYLIPI